MQKLIDSVRPFKRDPFTPKFAPKGKQYRKLRPLTRVGTILKATHYVCFKLTLEGEAAYEFSNEVNAERSTRPREALRAIRFWCWCRRNPKLRELTELDKQR